MVFCLLTLNAFMFFGCGSDEGDDSNPNSGNLTLSDLVETYALTGLKLIRPNGDTVDENYFDRFYAYQK